MRLTLQTDYALRTLMFAAVRKEDCTIPKIAAHYGISRNHLIVVVHNLGKYGFLKNTRGRGGGLALARPAEEITVGSVVRAFEPFDLVECFRANDDQCLISGPCRLRHVLDRALAAWLEVLDGTTLADLVGRNRGLVRLLKIGPVSYPGTA
jgi:Rrf2 family nitric oxide-sensitive transcriptional repressor